MGQREDKEKYDSFVVVEDQNFGVGLVFCPRKGIKDKFLPFCNRFGDCIFQIKDLEASFNKMHLFLFLFGWGFVNLPS